MGNLDRANVDARKGGVPIIPRGAFGVAAPQAPDNGAAEKAALLELDTRERALVLAIEAMKQGITPTQCWTDPEGKAVFVATKFYAFLKGDVK
ncbi:hypothetical protein [Arthrobacter sp. HY1533]|uniref:hypothetical protein n=1 Tax=Arthrobacter sp. HY1533 TaxID=2970919 RepID=UPI0022B9E6B6|nr:hypothetical protein [Arthrobacter sp. HY1533]